MLSRREALRGGTAAVVGIAAAGAVAAAGVPAIANTAYRPLLPTVAGVDDPVLGHWRWYQRLKAVYDANSAASIAAYRAGDSETCKSLEDEGDELSSELYDGPERAISRTVATTLAGCLVQARLLATEYVHDFDSHWEHSQDYHLAQSLVAGLERLAGEVRS